MDFRTTAAEYQYGVRASALIIHAGKLLTYGHDGKYFVPGGAVQVGEHSAARFPGGLSAQTRVSRARTAAVERKTQAPGNLRIECSGE